jgi:hypothetical protein
LKQGIVKIVINAMVAVCSIVMVVLALEVVCRWLFNLELQSIATTPSDYYYFYDRAGVRRHIPNSVGYEPSWDGQGKQMVRINSLGFRGREVSLRKPPGTRRIIFLGDSITLGYRLAEDDTLVERVGRKLNQRAKGRYEVVNAGVGDAGLQEEIDLLENNGLPLNPDLVVLCWYLNDGRPPQGFVDEYIYSYGVIGWFHRQGWLRHSYLAGFLYNRLRWYFLQGKLGKLEIFSRRFQWVPLYESERWKTDPEAFGELVQAAVYDWGDAWKRESRERMFAQIRRLRGILAANGVPLAVVAMPLQAQVSADFSSPFSRSAGSPATKQGRKSLLRLLPLHASRQRGRIGRHHEFPAGC